MEDKHGRLRPPPPHHRERGGREQLQPVYPVSLVERLGRWQPVCFASDRYPEQKPNHEPGLWLPGWRPHNDLCLCQRQRRDGGGRWLDAYVINMLLSRSKTMKGLLALGEHSKKG